MEKLYILKAELKYIMSSVTPAAYRRFRLHSLAKSSRSLLRKIIAVYSKHSAEKLLNLGTKQQYDHLGEILEEIYSSEVFARDIDTNNELVYIDRDDKLWWLLTCIYAQHMWSVNKPRKKLHWDLDQPSGAGSNTEFHHLRVPMIYYCRFRAKDNVMKGKWWNSYAAHLFASKPGGLSPTWHLIGRSSVLNCKSARQLQKIARGYYLDNKSKRVRRGLSHATRMYPFLRTIHELRDNYAIELLGFTQAKKLVNPIFKTGLKPLISSELETHMFIENFH